MLHKAKESGGARTTVVKPGKKNAHVRFSLPSSSMPVRRGHAGDANHHHHRHNDDYDHHHDDTDIPHRRPASVPSCTDRAARSSLSSSTSSATLPPVASRLHGSADASSRASSSSPSSSASRSSRRVPPSASSHRGSSDSTTSRVRLPPASFSYLSTNHPPVGSTRQPASSAFFAPTPSSLPPPSRPSRVPAVSSSSSSVASSSSPSPRSSEAAFSSGAGGGWSRYRQSVARADSLSSSDESVPAASQSRSHLRQAPVWPASPSPIAHPPSQEEDMSGSRQWASDAESNSDSDCKTSSALSSPPSLVPGTDEASDDAATHPSPSSSSSSIRSVPTVSSPSGTSSPPALAPSKRAASTSFACAQPFQDIKTVDEFADALVAWLIPPAAGQDVPRKKKTKLRFALEAGRLTQSRCSVKASRLSGSEVFELGELAGSIRNLLILVGSDELDTSLESKLVEEDGPDPTRVLLLNMLFHDECLFRAFSSILSHHRVDQIDAALLLSQSPADCRSKLENGMDIRLSVDAVISRSLLGFAEEMLVNYRKANASECKPRDSYRRVDPPGELTEEEQHRRAATTALVKCFQRLLGITADSRTPLVAGQLDGDALSKLACLLRALNDMRFFFEFDSLDECIKGLLRRGTAVGQECAVMSERRTLSDEGTMTAKKDKKSKEKKEKKEAKKVKKEARNEKEGEKRTKKAKSKLQSADSARVQNRPRGRDKVLMERSDREEAGESTAGDAGVESASPHYDWRALHEYLLSSYGRVVLATATAHSGESDHGSDSSGEYHRAGGGRSRNIGREIEEGILNSVRDMMIKLQCLSAIHSLRLIVGDEVLVLRCEGMDLFRVLPSADEIEAMDAHAMAEAKKKRKERARNKKNEMKGKRVEEEGTKLRSSSERSPVSQTPMGSAPTGSAPLPKREKVTIKLMLLGDSRVGKTCLIQRFVRGSAFTMPMKYKPTFAADFVHKSARLRGKTRTLQIWDTSGNERQRAPDRAFFKGVDALILTFDQRRDSTFLPSLTRHLDDFLAHSGCTNPRNLPVIVIGTCAREADDDRLPRDEAAVNRKQVEAWGRERVEGLFAYFACSAKEGRNVEEAFLHAADAVLSLQ